MTSGTTGYYPNPSEVAVAASYHGPWQLLNDPHPDDPEAEFKTALNGIQYLETVRW